MCIIKGPYSNFIFHVEECYAQPENKLFSKTPYGGGRVGGMAWDAVKRRHQGILFFLHTSVCLFGNVEVVLKPGDTCSGSSLNRNSSESIMSFGATDTLQFGGYTGDSEISPRSFMLSTAAAGQLVAPGPTPQLFYLPGTILFKWECEGNFADSLFTFPLFLHKTRFDPLTKTNLPFPLLSTSLFPLLPFHSFPSPF